VGFGFGMALMPVLTRVIIQPNTPGTSVDLAVEGFLFQRVAPDIQSLKHPMRFTRTVDNINQPAVADCFRRFEVALA
jgi:hypothetical protein